MASNTPWGISQQKTVVCRGLTLHDTPGHGGFLAAKGWAGKNLSPAAIVKGMPFGGYYAYEEDCLANIILLEIPESRKCLANKEITDAELIKSISYYDPDYLLARNIQPEPEAYARYLSYKEDTKRRNEKDPDLIVSALGLDDEVCKVVTADGAKHFVTLESYQERKYRVSNNLSDCVKVENYTQTTYLYY